MGEGDAPAVARANGLPSLWAAIWRIEQELDLFRRELDGVFYWPLLRIHALDRLARQRSLHAPPPRKLRITRARRALTAASALAATRAEWGEADSILIPLNRKQIRDGRLIDIFSERILHDKEFGRFLICDNDSDIGSHAESDTQIVRNWDSVRVLSRARAGARFVGRLAGARQIHAMLDAAFRRELGAPFPFSPAQIAYRCAVFDEGRRMSRKIFARAGARRLFVVAQHSTQDAIAAANDLSMTTIELQHGFISAFDPFLHFPGRPNVPYSPAHLLTFGRFWAEQIDLPRNTRAHVMGWEPERNKALPSRRNSRQVLVISQWIMGQQLAQAAADLARAAPDWNVVFRPHPSEDVRRYREEFAAAPPNLSVSSREERIDDLLAESAVQIGVYSTSLFEGMGKGLRTIVFALPGFQYMRDVIEIGDAALARSVDEAVALLETAPVCADPARYYAAPVASVAHLLSDVLDGESAEQ
ncbi:hypothetical protein BH09PSE4_BH09PSE4_15890 [soil metagenome]